MKWLLVYVSLCETTKVTKIKTEINTKKKSMENDTPSHDQQLDALKRIDEMSEKLTKEVRRHACFLIIFNNAQFSLSHLRKIP